MTDQPRPVWLTTQHANALTVVLAEDTRATWVDDCLSDIHRQWNAAPADPVEAVVGAFRDHRSTIDRVYAVLRALGMPEKST